MPASPCSYLKVDGCGDNSYYPQGYSAMGAALEASGRDIVYSCSWPAYIGSNESVKPFNTFIMDGCNLWRNWNDIQCDSRSLLSIVDHVSTPIDYCVRVRALPPVRLCASAQIRSAWPVRLRS